MKYSAGIVSSSFWLIETKTTAKYILDGFSRTEIINLALTENIYQVNSERRAREMANTLYKRLKDFPEEILQYFVNADINSSKLLVLISILKKDKLFFEFMYEVFREHVILGNFSLKKSDFVIFFEDKSNQSDIIEKWTEKTVKRLGSVYRLFLSEAGILDNNSKDEFKIVVPFLDFRLRELLVQNNLKAFIKAITGEN